MTLHPRITRGQIQDGKKITYGLCGTRTRVIFTGVLHETSNGPNNLPLPLRRSHLPTPISELRLHQCNGTICPNVPVKCHMYCVSWNVTKDIINGVIR